MVNGIPFSSGFEKGKCWNMKIAQLIMDFFSQPIAEGLRSPKFKTQHTRHCIEACRCYVSKKKFVFVSNQGFKTSSFCYRIHKMKNSQISQRILRKPEDIEDYLFAKLCYKIM
ncbi:CLUMA_CG016666, isoform A [Clunio marinus]|uniref:CLUMA_CG016666, isoform A n=1 Tax=Clunio marinus TaxID=568069 RepID=A0A1J1ITE5_9DIPT|nr:CLUMA_CG016666, isoform A [Clunio marinus]